MRPLHWLTVLALLGLTHWRPADEFEPWTPRDFVFQESASDFAFSPDGHRLVWAKTTMNWEEQERRTRLQLTDLDTNETLPLTQGKSRSSSPRWSPDGKWIAFLTDRPDPEAKGEEPEGEQIWLIRATGGEAFPLTHGERGVDDFAWAGPDSIVFIAAEFPAVYERELKERKDDSLQLDDEAHEPPVRLFGVDVKTGDTVRLSHNTDWIQSLSVSPDGTHAVTVHAKSLRYDYDQKTGPEVRLWDLEETESEPILSDFRHGIGQVAWKPDAKGFYFSADYSTDPKYIMASESRLYDFDLESKKSSPIPLQTGKGLLFGMIQAHPQGVLALLEDGVRSKLALYSKSGDGWTMREIEGAHVKNLWSLDVSRDGERIVYSHAKADLPEQYFAARLSGGRIEGEKAFTELNPRLSRKKLAKVEAIQWKGARDESVEGLLYYPQDYESGKKYPLVLLIHGGPLGHDADSWNDGVASPIQLLCQKGAFVLLPNYHGSSGYGLAFAESIGGGNYYTLPVEDLQRGVESLIAKGLADPDRLASMGWSNGAILTVALIVKDPRFKAASVGAGGAEWTSDWGACAFGQAFSNYYMGKAPIEDPDLYRKNAPIYDFDKVRTPTIFFHGTADTAVPTFHSLSMYRTLQYLGKAPTRLVMFPGEPHGIGKPAHRLRKLEEEAVWFDRYLFGKPAADPIREAVREGSSLSDLIELLKAKRVDGHYGEKIGGVLVPETVALGELRVGRFEVTRAQFAAFDSAYKFEPGTEDMPANGISFDKAKAYCEWLSKKTGRTYRLPREDEAEKLYGDGANGNTLDGWAGYPVNPDDALKLREVLKSLPSGALLVKVGRTTGVGGEAKVYDLGGNVAEWVVLKSGGGVPMGGSADTPEDPSSELMPEEAYIGFRVILEEESVP